MNLVTKEPQGQSSIQLGSITTASLERYKAVWVQNINLYDKNLCE